MCFDARNTGFQCFDAAGWVAEIAGDSEWQWHQLCVMALRLRILGSLL